MNISSLSLNTNILSLGALLGSSGQQAIIDSINERCGGSSFFGSMTDPFRNNFQHFMQQVIEPIRQVQQVLYTTASKLRNPDEFRPIESIKDLEEGIPPCMHLGIVYHHPIRKMLEEERIDGFGIDPNTLCDEDPFERVLENGHVIIHSSTLGENGEYTISFKECSTDPIMSQTDVEALRRTRAFIDEFYQDEITKVSDFTNYPNLHG